VAHTTVSEGQRALACASVENSFAPTGLAGVLGAGLAVEVGGGEGLAAGGAAAVGVGAGVAGAAVGAGAGAGGVAGAAVG
jgi:hypothetical protein